MWFVGCFQLLDFVGGEFEFERAEGVFELVELACSDDGRGDDGLGEDPGQGYLRGLDVACCGDFDHAIDDIEVLVLAVEAVGEGVGAGAEGFGFAVAALAGAGEHAAREWAPGNAADLLVEAERDHLAFFFTVDEIVVVLHGDKAREVVGLLKVEHLLELPRVHAGGAKVERLACLDHVVESFAGLFDGRVGIEAVNLVEVDVIDVETLERGVDGGHDVLAREAAVVRRVGHGAADFGGDDEVFAAGLELAEEFAGDDLTVAERVHVGGVEEVDASLDGALDKGASFIFGKDPLTPLLVAVGHHAEAEW